MIRDIPSDNSYLASEVRDIVDFERSGHRFKIINTTTIAVSTKQKRERKNENEKEKEGKRRVEGYS